MHKSKINGATMIVVLMILISLTVIGIAAMRYSVIEQKAASNLQIEKLAFNTADSAISALINAVDRKDSGVVFPQKTGEINSFCVQGKQATLYVSTSEVCAGLKTDVQQANVTAEALGCVVCPNVSLAIGGGAPIQCQGWKLTGNGVVGDSEVDVEHWVTKLSPACS